MNIPNFHDGRFDGLRIYPDKQIHLFLRTVDGSSFILALHGVDALTLSEVKQGNIIFDLNFRRDQQVTTSDIEELYGVNGGSPQSSDLLRAKRDRGLQLLEINSSYGAHGLVLFQTFEIRPSTSD